MSFLSLLLLFNIYCSSEAGVTEIRPQALEDVVIETVSDDSWMPSNIFDVQRIKNVEPAVVGKLPEEEQSWSAESSPFFRAIRDFIFQAGDGLLETEERNDDPTEEIVKIIEKGLIEATTMFLTPSDELAVSSSTDSVSDPISVLKIENDATENMLDRIGMNIFDFPSNRQTSVGITNTSLACSNCYNTLESCVQQCFVKHDCHDVQRQARMCPPPSGSICNIFTQWGPVDECKVHEDCKSPLLCCSDGCANKCSPGIWRN